MRFDSMVYTMGTALNRAEESGTQVSLLVGGEWLSGRVLAVDGHGVVLDGGADSHAVVKVEDISAVRVMSGAPAQDEPDVSQHHPADEMELVAPPRIVAM